MLGHQGAWRTSVDESVKAVQHDWLRQLGQVGVKRVQISWIRQRDHNLPSSSREPRRSGAFPRNQRKPWDDFLGTYASDTPPKGYVRQAAGPPRDLQPAGHTPGRVPQISGGADRR